MLASYTFRPSLGAVIATAVLLPILLALGFWQLDRAQQKQAMLDRYAAVSEGPVLTFEPDMAADADLRYQVVEARGRYLPRRQWLLDNQVRDGRVGYFVFTALQLRASEQWLLVNRGWVPASPDRQQVPDITVSAQPRVLRGRIAPAPDVGLRLEVPPGDDWPPRLQYIDVDELSARNGASILPSVLLLEPGEPDGYRRDWKVVPFGPEKHLGYAVQWFGLAATLLVIFLVVNVKRREN